MLYALLLACATPGLRPEAPPPAAGPTLRERFGDWPFLTPIDAPPTVALIADPSGPGLPTDAATCGACHTSIYAEWRQTTHASAIHDLQYLAELAKPDNPRWLCLNCHAPTQPQRVDRFTLDTRLASATDITRILSEPNPDAQPERAAEGVTCATCHVRRDADGQGVIVGPYEDSSAPHRVRVDATALTDVCVRCHSPGPAVISPTFFCWFQTADELARGDHAGASCPSCHMPAVERAIVPGGPLRATRGHDWVGGGVPKSVDGYDTLLARGYTPGLSVTTTRSPTISVTLANHAGHSLPTADPERFLRVEARLEDVAGHVLARDVVRLGQTWDWGDAATGRPARRTADSRLEPGETRVWRPTLPSAPDATLVVEAIHVRVTPANAAGMAHATLDDELTALWPEAPSLLPRLDTLYPLATYVWRERVPANGAGETASPEALVAASKALAAAPLDEKTRLLAVP